jgi:prephenate dehydratase
MSGHLTDPPIAEALVDLKERAQFIKILGSYPRAI